MELIQQNLTGDKIIPRLKQSKYDPHSIEGRTSEAAARQVGRYELIFISAQRIRELNKGQPSLIKNVHGNRVTAIQEIEQGLIDGAEYFLKSTAISPKRYK
jgi:DNA-directed RNA polymerase omega subunit